MGYRMNCEQVSLYDNERPILQNVSLGLAHGEHLIISGESGSGISSLLHLCAGIELPDTGRVFWEHLELGHTGRHELLRLRCRMGCVLQSNALISNMTVYDNCALALRYFKIAREVGIRARVTQLLERLHIAHAIDLLPERLSHGEARRVALARACVLAPDFLILDHLFAGVDDASMVFMQEYLDQYTEKYVCSILMGISKNADIKAFDWPVIQLRNGRIAA